MNRLFKNYSGVLFALLICGTAVAKPELPDWDAPTTDQRVIRARDKKFINQKLYGGVKTPEQWTKYFHEILRSGDALALEYLISLGKKKHIVFNLDASLDDQGNTALHLLAKTEHRAAIKVLLKHGASINVVNTGFETPLILAVEGRYNIAAKTFLADKNADLLAKRRDGDTALSLAVRSRNEDLAVAVATKLSAAVIEATQFGETTVLKDYALKTDHPLAAKIVLMAGAPTIEFLIQAIKTDAPQVVGVIISDRRLKLMNGDLEKIKAEVSETGDLDSIIALGRKYKSVFKWTFTNGDTLAHVAAKRSQVDALDQLKKLGVSLNGRNLNGESPLDVARFMQQEWAKTTAANGNFFDQTVEYLTKNKKSDYLDSLDVNSKTNRFDWIYDLIKDGHLKKLIKAYGIDWLSRVTRGDSTLTLLHWAVIHGDGAILETLLTEGLQIPPTTLEGSGNDFFFYFVSSFGGPNLIEAAKRAGVRHEWDVIKENERQGIAWHFVEKKLKDYTVSNEDDVILILAKRGLLAQNEQLGRHLLVLGSKRNSVRVIEAAYARGETPIDRFSDSSDASIAHRCAPTDSKAIDAYLKHPDFRNGGKFLEKEGAVCSVIRAVYPYFYRSSEASPVCPSQSIVPRYLALARPDAVAECLSDLLRRGAVFGADIDTIQAVIAAGLKPQSKHERNALDAVYSAAVDNANTGYIDVVKHLDYSPDGTTYLKATEELLMAQRFNQKSPDDPKNFAEFEKIRLFTDELLRVDAKQVNPNLTIGDLWVGSIDSEESNQMNAILRRLGEFRKQYRQSRDCDDATAAIEKEYSQARKNADGLFEILWAQALKKWKELERKNAASYRALLSILDPRALKVEYFKSRTYTKAILDLSLKLEMNYLSYGNFSWSYGARFCGFGGNRAPFYSEFFDSEVVDYPNSWYKEMRHVRPLRWACAKAYERPHFENSRFIVSFGAFEKKKPIVPLTAVEVSTLLAEAPESLEAGLQVALVDGKNRSIARVLLPLWPIDHRHEKERYKQEFMRELEVEDSASYFAQQYPHCVKASK